MEGVVACEIRRGRGSGYQSLHFDLRWTLMAPQAKHTLCHPLRSKLLFPVTATERAHHLIPPSSDTCAGGRIEVEVAISRLPSGSQGQTGAGAGNTGAGGAQPGFAKGGTAARLLVGSCHDDRLLLMKSMVVETFPSPFTVRQGQACARTGVPTEASGGAEGGVRQGPPHQCLGLGSLPNLTRTSL